MRLTAPVTHAAAQWPPQALPTEAEQTALALAIVQQAQALGGRMSLAETEVLVQAVERRFPHGDGHRVGLWSHLLGAGLDPNARLMTCPRGPGWDDNFEPVYFSARNAAELEQFMAHGADPRVTDDSGYGQGDRRYRRLVDRVQAHTEHAHLSRYDADMLLPLASWTLPHHPSQPGPARPAPSRSRYRR